MARIPSLALMGVLALVVACGAERSGLATDEGDPPSSAPSATSATPTEPEATPTASATPAPPPPALTPTPPPDPTPTAGVLPLSEGFPDSAALIDATDARVGVAVIAPDGDWYLGGDDGTFALASVAKLPLMVATLENAKREARPLTEAERDLLQRMVTASNNAATDTLWAQLGEGAGIAQLLDPYGLADIDFATDDQWGDTRASAAQIAALLDLLISDESALDPALQREALDLMETVVADQRWGASAGVDYEQDGAVTLAIKNGWYPETTGWLLNSAGIITVTDSTLGPEGAHVVVVLTEGAADQTIGVRAIEEIAAAINHQLVPETVAIAVDSPTFAAWIPTDPTATEPPAATPTPTPTPEPPAVVLVGYAESSDVLVPLGASLLASEDTQDTLTLWYELSSAAASEMLSMYGASMSALGWNEVTGPPSIVLSKTDEGRWIGLSVFPAPSGERLVEVTIAPAPSATAAGLQ